MNIYKTFCFGVLLLCSAETLMADECDSILEQGVRNTYQELKNRDLRTGFRDAICQSTTSGGQSSAGGGLDVTLPIYGVPVSFGGNYDEAKSSTTSSGSCRDTSSSLNDATYSAVLQQVVAKEIVSAWSECKNNKGGFYINGELNGNVLALEFRFRPIGSITSTELTGEPDITGADCPGAIVKKGTVITNAKLIQKCYRVGNGEITVIANSTVDGAKFFIPAVQKSSPLPVVIQPQIQKSSDCKRWENWGGLGIPPECLGSRKVLDGVGVAPDGYSWCVIDRKFSADPNVQTYCITRSTSGACRCDTPPLGWPQPKGEYGGTVHSGQR